MISTHVLDTALGRPAAGVPVVLERLDSTTAAHAVAEIARASTDGDGRVRELLPNGVAVTAGDYRLTFDTASYFAGLGTEAFYPVVTVTFTVRDPAQHHHVPLLLSPYGYATYRGS